MLSNKQEKFVNEYMIDFNATQAAIRSGYDKSSARSYGARLVANPSIQAEIHRRQNISNQNSTLTREYILETTKEILENNKIKNPHVSLKAAEIILKMQGWNEPDRVEQLNNSPITIIKTIEVKREDGTENKD